MYIFKIESLNCMSCYYNIDDVLKDFDSTIESKADVKNQTLTVVSQQPVEKLTQLIESAGYPISGVTND